MAWALITGASEGLGREFAKLAAKDGHDLILTARSKDKLNALAEEMRALGREVVVIPADLSDTKAPDMLWDAATKGREIGILVNNAGLGRNGHFSDGGWDREQDSIQVNVMALTALMKKAIPHMIAAGRGRILNVASVAGFLPGPNMAIYHASKAFVLSLSEAVAEELSGGPVTVTVLCPGPTATEFFNAADMNSARLLKMSKPMKASDVAEAGWLAARVGTRVVVPGAQNKASVLMARLSPRSLTAKLAGRMMGKT
jgi:short-subunit dehydrogenase